MQGRRGARPGLLLVAAVALAALTPPAAQAQIVEVDLNEYIAGLEDLAASLSAAPVPPIQVPRLPSPECSAYPASLPLNQITASLAVALRSAAEALKGGDYAGFEAAKFGAYNLVACYALDKTEVGRAVKLSAFLLLAAQPSPAGTVYFVQPGLPGDGEAPGTPGLPPGVEPPPPPLPPPPPAGGGEIPAPGGAGGGGSLGDSGGIGASVPGGDGEGSSFDVRRLIEALLRARNATGSIAAGGPAPSLPGAPQLPGGLGESVLAVAALAALIAGRGALASAPAYARALAAVARGLLRGRPAVVSGRECYRIALAGAERLAGRRKEAWETPREYLAVVEPLLERVHAERLRGATMAYEAEVYAGRRVEVGVGDCIVGGGRWRRFYRGRR